MSFTIDPNVFWNDFLANLLAWGTIIFLTFVLIKKRKREKRK